MPGSDQHRHRSAHGARATDAEGEGAVQPFEYFLQPGFLIANREPTIVRGVFGNCVGVTLYDQEQGFGGMSHFILPEPEADQRATPQFGEAAIQALWTLFQDLGCSPHAVEAQIVGGARQADRFDADLGARNVAVARAVLDRLGVPVASEDVGGRRGRKVIYHTGTNETVIYKVDRIRQADWVDPAQGLDAVGAR